MSSSTTIMVGHVLDRLRELPAESVHMVWTSVPYWGLRDYGTEPQVWGGEPDCAHEWGSTGRIRRTGGTASSGLGNYDNGVTAEHIENKMRRGRELDASTGAFCQRCGAWRGEHGLEPTLELWLTHEVSIFREVWRVLRRDGTVWLNCGDAYATAPAGRGSGAGILHGTRDYRDFRDKRIDTRKGGFKPKDRLMMPARLAIALQDDGWWLRDEIVWHKRNPMPSSVEDRTTPAHEMMYLLAKSRTYFYDFAAIMERTSGTAHSRGSGLNPKAVAQGDPQGPRAKQNSSFSAAVNGLVEERNKRSVWSIVSEPFRGAHFATAPTALVEPCVLAGTSQAGVCPHCGAPWHRHINRVPTGQTWKSADGWASHEGAHGNIHRDGREIGEPNQVAKRIITVGWMPSCGCPEHTPVPATVLDPFGGAGTTALVANRLGRNAILIELNPEYAETARARLRAGLARVTSDLPEPDPNAGLPLFEAKEVGA